VSVEGIPDLPTREISLPWGKAAIPEGRLRVVRTGSRDYLDIATAIASTSAASRLEADIFLASRHPSITRDKWFRLERVGISNRTPSPTSEEFTLLSYAARLKRKIPQKVETINSVHTVASCSTVAGATEVVVSTVPPSTVLPQTSVGGNEYDGRGYYMRVRSTSAPNTPPGYLATIQGNTDTTKLDFVPLLPENLVAGDVIEVHSGIFQTQAVTWSDYDPADAWWEVLTNLLAIPPERIGLGSLPRGGRPPKVTDIAPGDVVTQAKRKITGRLSEETEGIKVLDILSAIMGGVTLEIDGQIVFVQLYPLVDIAGAVTVPLPALAAVFDARDFSSPPQMPPGLEKRTTVLTTKYGVPATAASPDSFPTKATTAVDNDALLWLSQQDFDDYGTADTPDEIAAWLYSSPASGGDSGLYLASSISATTVRAISTGLRVFGLSMTEKHPKLAIGDVIAIVTDGYTDYDPSSGTRIKGPIAVRGVLVRVGNEGRQLGMFVPGLRDNVQLLKGGNPGALTGLGSIPDPPILSASFDASGQLIINSSGDFAVASQKIAWATGAAPSAATVRAAAPIAQQNISGLATGVFYPAGTTVFISAFSYSGNGVESTPLAVISQSREGAGVPAPPVAFIAQLNTETDDTVRNLRFNASAGSGGGGVNITYDIRLKTGFAAEVSLASGNGTTLPRDLSIARDPQYDGSGIFIVTDTATGQVARAFYAIPAQRGEVAKFGGTIVFRRPTLWSDLGFAARANTDDGLTLNEGMIQDSAGSPRSLLKGYQSGFTVDGGVVVFAPVYQNGPAVRFSGGKAANASFPYDDFAASSLTASGFTCRAKNRSKGTVTTVNDEFTAPLSTSTVGGTVGPASLSSATSGASDNNYKARFRLTVSCTTSASPPGGQTTAVVAIEASADGGSTWTEYATVSKAVSRTSAGTTTTTFEPLQVTINVPGLSSSAPADQVRLKLKSVFVTPGATGSATVEGFDNSPAPEGHGLVFVTATGATDQPKTPDADDFIFWEAWEKDS
jgi:hypothetical protein